jgi:hypothetical protein
VSFSKGLELHASKPRRLAGVSCAVQQALRLATKKEAESVVETVVAALEATLLNNLETNGSR